MSIVTPTPTGVAKPRVDLIKSEFEILVWQKGYNVQKEAALKCPCSSKNINQLSDCKNCGGTGWVFINPTDTKMMIHSINLSTKFKEWSQENLGTVSITCLSIDELSYMDRITILDANAIFSQVCFMKQSGATNYFSVIYPIKEILYIALFINSNSVLTPLVYGTDFTYSGNRIIFLTADNYIDPLASEQDISITVRYKHAPQLHVLDLPRETMQTYNKVGNKEDGPIDMPIHAIGRRSHYVLDEQNFAGDRILNNDLPFVYEDLNPPKVLC